jgi:hypothetical protein
VLQIWPLANAHVLPHQMAKPGNGLLLFFRVDNFHIALQRARALVSRLEEKPHVNPSTGTMEFRSKILTGTTSPSVRSMRPNPSIEPAAHVERSRMFRVGSNSGADSLFTDLSRSFGSPSESRRYSRACVGRQLGATTRRLIAIMEAAQGRRIAIRCSTTFRMAS